MTKEGSASEPVFCPWPSGRCFFPNIISATSIGPRSRPTKHASMPTYILEPHQAGGAVREGAALLQGLATCGKCGRRLHTHYTRQKRGARLPLRGQGYRSGARRVLSQCRRRPNRSSGCRCFSQSSDTRGAGSNAARYPATRSEPRCGAHSVAPGGGTCSLRSRTCRASISCR